MMDDRPRIVATLIDHGGGALEDLAWEFDPDYPWELLGADHDTELAIRQLALELWEHVLEHGWRGFELHRDD